MRYAGQGHEIAVTLPPGKLAAQSVPQLKRRFDTAYRSLYGRIIPGMGVEVMSWSVTVSTRVKRAPRARSVTRSTAKINGKRKVFEPRLAKWRDVPVYERNAIKPGARMPGPALIVEDQTTIVVTADFDASVNSLGYIVLDKRNAKRT